MWKKADVIFYLCRNSSLFKPTRLFSLRSSQSTDNATFTFPSDIDSVKLTKRVSRDQTSKSFRPNVDPSTTSVLLFPGQGSQFVGMGKSLLGFPEAKELYTIASDIVKYDVLKLCVEGPAATLNKTEVCQIAVLVTSIAALVKLREESPDALETCVAAAGYSVGEYAALVFAGCISFEDAVKVVQMRAQAMQAASDALPSGLMTVFLNSSSKLNFAMLAAREYCKDRLDIQNPVCSISSYLFPDAKVIGGHKEALDFIKANLSEFNLKRVKELPVSGAFHTPLMKPAVAKLREALDQIEFRTPVIPVHSNVNCASYTRFKVNTKTLLLEQLYKPVRWEQTMHTIYQRKEGHSFPKSYEVGPGGQLGTILKMVNAKAHQSYNCVQV